MRTDTDRNLLFAVLTLQVDLINIEQFAEACTRWSARKQIPISDLLVEFGWIEPADKADVERLMKRRIEKHDGDMQASLGASIDSPTKDSLARIDDPDIDRSLIASRSPAPAKLDETVLHVSKSAERYSRQDLHARGGIGEVWLARDHQLGRNVALKRIRTEMADHDTVVSRFLNEAQITGQLEHPGIVPVYELANETDNQPFYTMRFVNGRTLKDAAVDFHRNRIAGQTDSLEFAALLNAFVVVCKTIAYAHSRGVIHRDLKGENVIIGNFGEVVVLDWGLAKLVGTSDEGAQDKPVAVNHQANMDLTIQGDAIGTPTYMAPEQAAGQPDTIDERTDVYGLGAMLYHLLTGKPPFEGKNLEAILQKVRLKEPIPPKELWDDVPDTLQAACLRALAKDPATRFSSAGELAHEVEQWQEVQRQQAIDALIESEALYQSLMECVSLNVWRKDLQGRFTFVNKGFCEAMEIPRHGWVGKTDHDIWPRELADKYVRDDARVHETGETLRILEPVVLTTGVSVEYEVIKIPIYDARGNIVGTQGVFWDPSSWNRLRADDNAPRRDNS